MNIILIGYRCTGKTSVGKKLAEKLAVPFYDTDHILTDRFGKTIREWVAEKGWPSFRQEEKRVIREIASLDSSVIALGGGAVLDPENRETLRNRGLILWLTADVQTILTRMKSDVHNKDNRPPLLKEDGETEIQKMLIQRNPLYKQMAHYTVNTKARTIEDIVAEIGTTFTRNRITTKVS